MSLQSAARLCLAMIFLFAQLSLSWAAALPAADDSHCGHAGHDMSVVADCVAVNHTSDNHQHGSDLHEDCTSDCQMCAVGLPVSERPVSFAPIATEPVFKWQTLPPGTLTHPYRPPATS